VATTVYRVARLGLGYCLLALSMLSGQTQSGSAPVPSKFSLDLQTAARLRPLLIAQSTSPGRRYATGAMVLKTLVEQGLGPSRQRWTWVLRIAEDGGFNAYSSPDGAIFVENGLADLAGTDPGLWAALLSHEVAHVTRRDWARRYLYEQQLQSSGSTAIVLGDPGVLASSYVNSEKASMELGHFCRQLELEADRESLTLMVRAGYHPDFVPALHHILQAHLEIPPHRSERSMHPCWEARDRELGSDYVEASVAFEHLWPDWNATPGGNPPVLVFADRPTLRKTGTKEWEISLPLHCQNLAGAVEVVLSSKAVNYSGTSDEPVPSDPVQRELTGCTSPRAKVSFHISDPQNTLKSELEGMRIYVVDAWGSVLARADLRQQD